MNKKFKFIIPAIAIVSLTSCDLFDNAPWSWKKSTNGFNINYCLLIGQIDHNDSMYRTRGTREELGTRVEEKYQKANFNLEGVKQGHITLNDKDNPNDKYKHDESVPAQEFKVNELESLEQKSFSGATWDPITANATTGTWINKHDKSITLFVSNNDGMAEGAIKAYNWKKNLPIFGYDSNISTLKIMKEKDSSIMGTIDSNTVGQCLTTSVIIRNIYEASKPKMEYADKNGNPRSKIDAMWQDDGEPYNPIYEGFQYDDEAYAKEAGVDVGGNKKISYGSGYVHSTVTFDGCLNKDLTDNPDSHHAILLKNRSVTNDKYLGEDIDPSGIETDYFFDDKGEALETDDLYDKAEGSETEKDPENIIKVSDLSALSVWQSWYSKTDTFFTGNMNPYFKKTQASNMFNLDVSPAEGDGSDEKLILDQLDAALGKGASQGPQAFLINPVQQSNSPEYITRIAKAYGLKEQDDWSKRSNIPVIFWNRQPTDLHGNVSAKDVMNNKYFKYTYYVGFDAKQGGELQGQMIRAWLNKTYIEHANLEKEK